MYLNKDFLTILLLCLFRLSLADITHQSTTKSIKVSLLKTYPFLFAYSQPLEFSVKSI